MHKPNQIIVLKDGTKVIVKPKTGNLTCSVTCYFKKHLGFFHYECNENLVCKLLDNCKAPVDYCYQKLTKFGKGV